MTDVVQRSSAGADGREEHRRYKDAVLIGVTVIHRATTGRAATDRRLAFDSASAGVGLRRRRGSRGRKDAWGLRCRHSSAIDLRGDGIGTRASVGTYSDVAGDGRRLTRVEVKWNRHRIAKTIQTVGQ